MSRNDYMPGSPQWLRGLADDFARALGITPEEADHA